jgi:hypothetical protein
MDVEGLHKADRSIGHNQDRKVDGVHDYGDEKRSLVVAQPKADYLRQKYGWRKTYNH